MACPNINNDPNVLELKVKVDEIKKKDIKQGNVIMRMFWNHLRLIMIFIGEIIKF